MSQHKVLWTVGLSNGQNLYEEKGNFKTITGELSPWQRLKRYIVENGVSITSFSLYTNDGKRWTLPSAGKNPRFRQLDNVPQPVEYNFFRKWANDTKTGDERWGVIEASYEGGETLQIWVDDDKQVSWSMFV